MTYQEGCRVGQGGRERCRVCTTPKAERDQGVSHAMSQDSKAH